MRVQDLMTTDVLTVRTAAPLKDAAALLAEHRISGLPVVDGDRHVLGVLSEGDILFKESGATRPAQSAREAARGAVDGLRPKARGQDGRRGDVGAGADHRRHGGR